MKRFIALLITAVLIVSVVGVTTAYAGSSISGPSLVLAGKSYTFTGKASYSAGDLIGKITGLGEVDSFGVLSTTIYNKKLSGTATIKVTIPKNAKPDDKFTIVFDGIYSVMASDGSGDNTSKKFSVKKVITVVDKLPVTPKAEVPPTQWELAQDSIALLEQGGTISLDITESAKVPAAVLDDITKKQAVVNINFANYSCSIDGSNFNVPSGLKELDLSLSMEKKEALSAAAGGEDAYQLHFGHSGQLPGPVTFKIKAENNSPGDTLYLYYYYDQSGKIEGKLSAVVDENGYVEFTIYHCSSYFLSQSIIDGALGGLAAIADNASKDAQILELMSTISELEAQLEIAQSIQPEPGQDIHQEQIPQPQDTKTQIAAGILDISIIEFGAIMLGALLLGIVGTIVIYRSGRKGRHAAVKDSSGMVSSDI